MNRGSRKGRGTARKAIVAYLNEVGPKETSVIAEDLGRSVSATYKALKSAALKGAVHLKESRHNLAGRPTQIWAAGKGPDPLPSWPPVQKLIELGPMTVRELVVEMPGWSYGRIRENLRRAGIAGAAHICAWEQKGALAAVWVAGPGVNKRRPRPLTASQRSSRYYQKHAALFKLRRAERKGQQRRVPAWMTPCIGATI